MRQIYLAPINKTARRRPLAAQVSGAAKRRLKWMEYYAQHGENARLTCRHFDISAQTFYRWRRYLSPGSRTLPPAAR